MGKLLLIVLVVIAATFPVLVFLGLVLLGMWIELIDFVRSFVGDVWAQIRRKLAI